MKPLDRRAVEDRRLVFRFVRASVPEDPELPKDFLSDKENGMEPFFKREKRYPELFDGMSMYGSFEAALAEWNRCRTTAAERNEAPRIPPFIGKVELTPGNGFDIEDLDEPDEHLTIWGDPARLADATRRIYDPEKGESD